MVGGACLTDAGQMSGFTTMNDFKMRFAERGANGEYTFSNVRNGLIVGLVCYTSLEYLFLLSNWCSCVSVL